MKLYLDDDSVHAVLVRLLRSAGHDVELPEDVGLAGRSDPIHLTHSVASSRVLSSANQDDFEELHDLLLQAGRAHPGVLIIRRDNDRRRDLTARGIVTAIRNLVASKISVNNQFLILNHWR